MRKTPKKVIYNQRPEKDSEFERPYLDDGGYPEMQHFHPSNFDIPYNPLDFNFNMQPPEVGLPCDGAVIDASSEKGNFPTINCNETLELLMGGRDGEGNLWNQDDVTWSILHGPGSIEGSTYVAPDCSEVAVDETANILGFTACGTSNIVVTIATECVQVTLNIIGPDAPVDNDCYTTPEGIQPLTWTISAGSIDSDGCVTVSGECGVGYITVTDDCGNFGIKQIRLPVGSWVQLGSQCLGTDPNDCGCGQAGTHNKDMIVGIFRWAGRSTCHCPNDDTEDESACCDVSCGDLYNVPMEWIQDDPTCWPLGTPPLCLDGCSCRHDIEVNKYEWQCP